MERHPGLPLGRPFGIPLFLAPSWVVAGVLVTLGAAPSFAPKGLSPRPRDYALGALASVLLATSVLAHELGHAAISLRLGVPVKRVTLFLFGGFTEMEHEPRTPAGEYLVAVAGPLVSVLLAGCAAMVVRTAPEGDVTMMATYLGAANFAIGVLNLLPGLPLDGGRLLRATVWHLSRSQAAGTRAGVRGGQTVALVVIAAGLVQLGAGSGLGFVEVLLGAFLWVNATALGRRSELEDRVSRIDVRALVKPALRVPATLPLAEALRRAVEAGQRLVVVDSYGVPAGVISGPALAAVPEKRRPWITVAEVTRRLEPGLVLEPGLDGPALVERMRATPATEYLVTGPDGEVEGVLSAHDVARALDGRPAP